jgi:hypothetical protein
MALDALALPALVMCEIVEFACAPLAAWVQFHHKWEIVVTVTVKHRRVTDE